MSTKIIARISVSKIPMFLDVIEYASNINDDANFTFSKNGIMIQNISLNREHFLSIFIPSRMMQVIDVDKDVSVHIHLKSIPMKKRGNDRLGDIVTFYKENETYYIENTAGKENVNESDITIIDSFTRFKIELKKKILARVLIDGKRLSDIINDIKTICDTITFTIDEKGDIITIDDVKSPLEDFKIEISKNKGECVIETKKKGEVVKSRYYTHFFNKFIGLLEKTKKIAMYLGNDSPMLVDMPIGTISSSLVGDGEISTMHVLTYIAPKVGKDDDDDDYR